MTVQGGWWQLLDIEKQREQEFEFWANNPPMACPICGEPLRNSPTADSGSDSQLYCSYAGDHSFHYPRDYIKPTRL